MDRYMFGQWQKRAPFWTMCSAAFLVLLLAGNVWAAGPAQQPMAGKVGAGRTNETLIVPFVNGDVGVQTVNSYSG